MASPPSHAGPARSPDIERFLNHLRPELAASFSVEQIAAVELHFAMRNRAGHTIDWRRRIGFGRLRGYLVVLAGRERGHD
ncbi:hypothetical protein [Acidocella sp.]|uniref:hypothetical protein n=1 Tax=Acidocella sp. TaxID=50710 RepID=UPI002607A7A6|nr:hypothetical protein [Acidocella sp.]